MKLDDNFRIEEDAYCWTLVERLKPRKKKDTEEVKVDANGEIVYNEERTYHGTLAQALTKYLDLSLKGSEQVRDVLTRLREAEKRIETATAGVRRRAA